MSSGATPGNAILASLLYATTPPRSSPEEPGRSVNRAAINPPVHDSPSRRSAPRSRATRRPGRRRAARRRRTACRRGGRGEEFDNAAYASAPAGSKRVETSISPRLRQVVISRPPRSTPVAARLPQRLGDLGLGDPEQAQHLAAGRRSPRRSPAETPRSRSRAPTSAAARAAGPGSTTTVGPARARRGTTSPGAVPTGSRTVAPAGIDRLLAVRRADRLRVDAGPALRQRARISAIRSSSRSSSTISRPLEAADDLCRHIVGGRAETAARDDQGEALRGHERSAREISCGRSPTIVV